MAARTLVEGPESERTRYAGRAAMSLASESVAALIRIS